MQRYSIGPFTQRTCTWRGQEPRTTNSMGPRGSRYPTSHVREPDTVWEPQTHDFITRGSVLQAARVTPGTLLEPLAKEQTDPNLRGTFQRHLPEARPRTPPKKAVQPNPVLVKTGRPSLRHSTPLIHTLWNGPLIQRVWIARCLVDVYHHELRQVLLHAYLAVSVHMLLAAQLHETDVGLVSQKLRFGVWNGYGTGYGTESSQN